MGFKHALASAYKRAFRSKPRKLIAAGIALISVGLATAVAFALAVDPGANSRIDYSMTFNGTNTYLSSTQQVVPATGDFTVESYVNFSSLDANDGWIWSTGTNGGSSSDLFGLAFAYSGVLADGTTLKVIDGSDTPTGIAWSSRIPMNDWVHIGLTYTQSTNKYTVFINAMPIYTSTRSVATIPAGFVVGRNAIAATSGLGSSSLFKGSIDEVKVFDTVRTQASISADAYDYLPSSTSGLRAEYDFNEGLFGGGTIYDRTSNNFDLTINGTAAFADIAQEFMTAATHSGYTRVRFNRTYLTSVGGWTVPGGVTGVTYTLYGGGAGGGGGASSMSNTNNGGGGGGGAGGKASSSATTFGGEVKALKVGLGGAGGLGQNVMTNATALQGASGGTSSFATSNSVGGSGGFGGGFASGTTTNTGNLGGKGGASGAGFAGATISSIADGGGGSGASAAINDSKVGGAGYVETAIAGLTMQVGGTGGVAQASSWTGLAPLSATASGGGGGKANAGTNDGYSGFAGSAGMIWIQYAVSTAATQDGDFLYSFDGSTQYAQAPPTSTALNLTGDFTLEAWVNPSNVCTGGYCVIAGRENNYLLGISNGTYRWQVSTSSGIDR